MDSDLAIRTEDLTKYYRKSFFRRCADPALSNLTLEVPRSSVFGFLGPNGAGKTTTIRCLMDLIRPTSGQAWVLGKPCTDIRIREKVGYLPDSPAFGAHLTAEQFLSICTRLLGIQRAERPRRISEVLDIVHMTRHRHSQLAGFSRGMLQRIGIAQALLNDPELLILDEPLVGLDPEGRKELLQIMQDRKEHGVAVFFCSHILSDVESLCDRIGILSEGRLKTSGPLEDLLAPNGAVLQVPAEQDELAKELMGMADSSHRGENNSWVLEFADSEKVAEVSARAFPEGVSLKQRKEKLEDLFFRMTKIQGGDEAEPAS